MLHFGQAEIALTVFGRINFVPHLHLITCFSIRRPNSNHYVIFSQVLYINKGNLEFTFGLWPLSIGEPPLLKQLALPSNGVCIQIE